MAGQELGTALELAAVEESILGGTVARRGEVVISHGSGSWLVDTEGRRYLDMGSAQGVALLGHSHPVLSAAIAEQAQRLISCPGFLYNETRARFAAALREVLPGHLRHLTLANSGAEAMDAALKFARLATGRTRFVAANKGFHGRTVGALSVTWDPAYRKPFLPLLDAAHVPYNNSARLEEAVDDETAAVVLEVVQGEGGVNLGSAEYLLHAQELCHARGALLIIDEIQTGFGRTGRWFASEHAGLQPDLMTLAKGLGGGFPMGAVAYGERVQARLYPGAHGSTFGGNPLACAAGLAAMGLYRDGAIEQGARTGAWLLEARRERVGTRTVVREVRGLGMMIAIELREKVAPTLKALMVEHGVIALPAGATVLRLLPPLTLSMDEAALAVEAIAAVLPA
jgi:acetylornithine/LysW-gamma-L-lysine aminotransferase